MKRLKRFLTVRLLAALSGLGLIGLGVRALSAGRPVSGVIAAWAGVLLVFLVWHHGVCRMNADLPPRDNG